MICAKNADLLCRKERLGKMRKWTRESGRAVFAFGSPRFAGADGEPDPVDPVGVDDCCSAFLQIVFFFHDRFLSLC